MISKDFMREFNKLNKKYPNAPIYYFGDYEDKDLTEVTKVVVAFAQDTQIADNFIDPYACSKNPQEGFSPIIVIG